MNFKQLVRKSVFLIFQERFMIQKFPVELCLNKMEGYSMWFDHLRKWSETLHTADYTGSAPTSLAVGDIVQQKNGAQHYKIQRIEYNSSQISQLELSPVSSGGRAEKGGSSARWMKIAPDEVDPVEHSVLQSHSTQHLLSLASTLLLDTIHPDMSNKKLASNQTAYTTLLYESTQHLSVVCDVLHSGGLSIVHDVRNFLVDGLDPGDTDITNTNTTTPTPAVDLLSTASLISAAHEDVLTLHSLKRRYTMYLSTVRDLYIILACLLDVTTRLSTLSSAAVKATEVQTADTVQDIENEASPVKIRNSTVHDDFAAGISSLLDKVLSLETVLVNIIELHPVPYFISVVDWAKHMCIVNTLLPVIQTLQRSLQLYTTTAKDTNNKPPAFSTHYENLLSTYSNTIQQAINTHIDYAVQAQVDFCAQSSIENILHQEWSSHSKYMRDKKLTHGIVSLCTSVRQSVYEIFQQQALYVRNSVSYCAHLSVQNSHCSVFSLQLLLSMAVLVSRAYLGYHLYTEEASTGAATDVIDNKSYKTLSPLLEISRVRTVQWQKDQYYFVYMVLETVIWVLSQDALNRNNAQVEGNDVATVVEGAQIELLLQSEPYAMHASVLSELLLVLKYLLLNLYISTGSAEEVTQSISTVISNTGSSTSESGRTSNSVHVWPELVELLHGLSNGDTLLACVNSGMHTFAAIGTTSNEELRSVPAVVPLDSAFRLFDDMHTHTGLYSFRINPTDPEEAAVYNQELQNTNPVTTAATAITAAQRAVVLHRISSMHIKNTDMLIAILTTDVERFCELHNVIHTSAPNPARAPTECVREFERFALLRRYEVNPATYPPLTAAETECAILVNAFLESMSV